MGDGSESETPGPNRLRSPAVPTRVGGSSVPDARSDLIGWNVVLDEVHHIRLAPYGSPSGGRPPGSLTCDGVEREIHNGQCTFMLAGHPVTVLAKKVMPARDIEERLTRDALFGHPNRSAWTALYLGAMAAGSYYYRLLPVLWFVYSLEVDHVDQGAREVLRLRWCGPDGEAARGWEWTRVEAGARLPEPRWPEWPRGRPEPEATRR